MRRLTRPRSAQAAPTQALSAQARPPRSRPARTPSHQTRPPPTLSPQTPPPPTLSPQTPPPPTPSPQTRASQRRGQLRREGRGDGRRLVGHHVRSGALRRRNARGPLGPPE